MAGSSSPVVMTVFCVFGMAPMRNSWRRLLHPEPSSAFAVAAGSVASIRKSSDYPRSLNLNPVEAPRHRGIGIGQGDHASRACHRRRDGLPLRVTQVVLVFKRVSEASD